MIDTTETFDDLHLSGVAWKLLVDFLGRETAVLVVPEVVVEETVNHFREKLSEAYRDQESASRTLAALTGNPYETRSFDIEASVATFRSDFLKKLQRHSAQILPMDAVAVSALVARALRRESPFDSKGQKGFRDALLWESLLKFITANRDQTYLVTRNTRDFGDVAALYPPLTRDLERLGVPVRSIEVSPSLKHLVEHQLRPKLTLLETTRESIQNRTFARCDAAELFYAERSKITSVLRRAVRTWDFGGVALYDPDFVSLNSLVGFEVSDVYRLTDGQLIVPIEYEATGQIEYFRFERRFPQGVSQTEHEEAEVVFAINASITIPVDPSEEPILEVGQVLFSHDPDG